jgi:hypothetical protein
MTIRADYDPRFFRRFLWIGLGCLAFTGWCFYDALVKYPHELKRAAVYWIPAEGNNGEPTGMEREAWRTAVRENNWSTADPPDKTDEIRNKIQSQYFYAGICLLIAIPCLLKWLLAKGTWVEADESALTTNFGPSFRFDEIEHIDKTRWEKKGIARIYYSTAGNKKSFAFDDFKYLREPMGKILRSIEAALSDEQISGGPREKRAEDLKAEPRPAEGTPSGQASSRT